MTDYNEARRRDFTDWSGEVVSGDREPELGRLLREAVRLIESADLRGANEILKQAGAGPVLETGTTVYQEEINALPHPGDHGHTLGGANHTDEDSG